MPPAFERGLIEFFSTFEGTGIHIAVGAPPSGGAARDLDWARVHMLMVDPEYYGKLQVLLFNLRKGVAEDVACRNAFGLTAAEIEARAKAHLAAGDFQTTSLPSRPLNERDLPARAVSDADARLARADLLAGQASADEYQALLGGGVKTAEALEGLGLLALRAGNREEALRRLGGARGRGQRQRALLPRVRQVGAGPREGRKGPAPGRRNRPPAR